MANQPKKYKKFVATAATATLVASAIVPVASAASLSDIAGNTHEEAITSLVDAGVINGYPDGTFQPNKTLTRSDVVKLLGKYLVSKGLEVPADYKTNVRFNDLTSASNDELLKYAAVVYDAGVFSGSNGNLLAGDNITRENMAVVLVRAFDTLNNIDLVSYVQGQEYKKDVKDLFTAKSEARSAIEVLDFFDITNPSVANFNPKGSTTRGQFATFLYKTINTDFSAVTGVANSAVSEIKAINNTTVEVTFKETVENIESLDFTIEGLEVKNAVVKQTNAKTVVLTTAAQTGDTVYTLNVNAAKAGTFKGVSAVIPTAVTMTTQSVQGKLGQQVTVKAQVTVAEGQSKAGIPVTFSVPGNNNDAVYPTVTGEAVTNAEGVATFTYTRYGAGQDTVTAYATGDRSKFAIGYVFWGVDTILAVTEVTEGTTINNGANKTYKITYKNPETGLPVSGKTFNVGFLENMNVTSDKVADASVNGVKALQLSNGTSPSAAQITTDSKGEATFTVSGTNAAVTPVVYELNSTTGGQDAKTYKASALQASAAKVTFGATQAEYKIEVTREGGEVAAIGATNGREYKVVVKDKDGKVAKNEIVNVAFNEDLDRVISTNTDSKFIDADNEVYYPNTASNGMTARQISVKTNDKGEATFVIGSDKVNDYATPVAWIDINTSNAKQGTLDEGEPKTVAPISYFQQAYLDGASVKSYDTNNKKQDKFKDAAVATFKAQLVNQSDRVISATIKSVSYTVYNTGSNDIEVETKSGKQTVSPNRSITVSYPGELSTADLKVNAADGKSSSVRVIATGVAINPADSKDFAFTAKEATATFTAQDEVTNGYIGKVVSVNTTAKTLTFAGKKAISLAGAKFVTENNTDITDLDAFVLELEKYEKGVEVQYSKDSEGKVTFKIVRALRNGSESDKVLVDKYITTLNNAKITVDGSTTNYATTTVDAAQLDVAGETLVVDGVTYTRQNNASPEHTTFFADLHDLAYKISKNSNVTVTAKVLANGQLELTKAINGEFEVTVNGTKVESSTGAVGVDQEITFTFTNAFNIATGDKVTVAGTTGTVASISSDKKTVVVKFAGTGIAANTPVTTFTVDGKTNNTINIASGGINIQP